MLLDQIVDGGNFARLNVVRLNVVWSNAARSFDVGSNAVLIKRCLIKF